MARVIPEENRVIVGRREEINIHEFSVRNINWFGPRPAGDLECAVRVRYQSRERACVMCFDGEAVRVRLKESCVVTPGQSAVFYSNDTVLGGGTITAAT